MRLRQIKIVNFRSIGELTKDFTDPMYLIQGKTDTGSNGAGKTSIMEAFFWVLTGKPLRGAKNEVIRRGTKKCEVYAEFDFKGKVQTAKRSVSGGITSFELNGEKLHTTKDTTQKVYTEIVPENAIKACFYGYNSFLDLPPSKRAEVFYDEILGLSELQSKLDNAKHHIKTEIRLLESHTANKQNVENALSSLDLASYELKVKEAEAVDKKAVVSTDAIVAGITTKNKEMQDITSNTPTVADPYQAQIDGYNTQIKECDTQIQGCDVHIQGYNSQLQEITNNYDVKHYSQQKLQTEYTDTLNRIKFFNDQISIVELDLKKIADTGNCTLCLQELNNNTAEEVLTKELKKHSDALLNKEMQKDDLSTKINNVQSECNALVESKIPIEQNRTTVIKQQEVLVQQRNGLEHQRKELEQKQRASKVDSVHLELINKLNREIAQLQAQYQQINISNQEIANFNHNVDLAIQNAKNGYTQQLNRKKHLDADLIEINKAYVDVKHKHDVYAFWIRGIKVILQNIVHNSVASFSVILNNTCQNLQLEFEDIEVSGFKEKADGSLSNSMGIYLNRKGEKIAADVLSTGERCRLNIACFVAIWQLLKSYKGLELNTLFFDEPLKGLDESGRSKMYQFLCDINREDVLLLCTEHSSDFADLFESVITIEKKDGISNIVD